jgi:hypothetical protein
MSAIISTEFRNLNARNFKQNILDDRENVYLFIGKSDKWSSTLDSTADIAPNDSTPHDTLLEVRDADSNMIALKSIGSTDVINLIPRYNWTSGNIYSAWDDDKTDIYDRGNDTPFYVLTDTFAIYKCLHTPKDSQGNLVASTVKPSHVPTVNNSGDLEGDPIKYADGYIWKFMFQITATESAKFLTNSYMPIKTVVGGAIATITAGSGGTLPTITNGNLIVGATSGATGRIYADESSGSTYALHSIRGAFIEGESITATGASLCTLTTITLGAATEVTENGDTTPEEISRLSFQNAAKQTLKGKIYTVAIDPTDPTAEVLSYGGSGYTSVPTITISGDGSSAAATATTYNNKVVKIDINQTPTAAYGSNYNVAFVTVGGPGSGCVARAVLSPKNGHGSSPAEELGGFYVGVGTTLTGEEGAGDFAADTFFRQVGLVKKPKQLSGGNPVEAISSTLSALKKFTVTVTSGTFHVGDYIQNSAGTPSKAYVDTVSVGPTSVILGVHQNDKTGYGSFSTGNTITAYTPGTISSVAAGTITTIAASEYVHFSGDVIFLENRASPIARSETQIEDIRIIAEF